MHVFSCTDGCPAATTTIDSHSGREDLAIDIRWPETDLGMTANRECPCGTLQLSSTQLRATRYCGGSFVAGAQWEAPSIAACNTSDITRLICSLSNVSAFTDWSCKEFHMYNPLVAVYL